MYILQISVTVTVMATSTDFRRAINQTLSAYKGTDLALSQRDLANSAGISEVNLSRFLNGKQDVTTETLRAILDAMPLEMRKHCLALIS